MDIGQWTQTTAQSDKIFWSNICFEGYLLKMQFLSVAMLKPWYCCNEEDEEGKMVQKAKTAEREAIN